QILGDIIHSSLAVENGAHFEGACRHSDDPLSEASASDFRKQRPIAQPAPAKPASPTTAAGPTSGGDAPVAPNGAGDAPSFLSPNRSPLR
ncbi:MAG: polymer-forming cytoskeletal protein, partial [Pseudomonadota bacterium]